MYPKFTKEMKSTHTILLPDMLPIHFALLKEIFIDRGYRIECLRNDGSAVVEEGLRHVQNDSCYPALLVVGQFIDALKSGRYDTDHVALMMTQTGGGCRASNYINLIRKGIYDEFPNIPVISLNFSNLEKDPESGFSLKPLDYIRMVYMVYYGDLLMSLGNQVRPYEEQEGRTDRTIEKWSAILIRRMKKGGLYRMKRTTREILEDFRSIPVRKISKIKVGIVGEIYVKYSPLANNHLEDFLKEEGCEAVVPALMDFVMYAADATIWNHKNYRTKNSLAGIYKIAYRFMYSMQKKMNRTIRKYSDFEGFHDFEKLKAAAQKYISEGVVMGEGWLIPAEMALLIESGTENIVTCQPFGCLPNHIVSKGMRRVIKRYYPEANIVAIDYDPGATRVNQENRIKLMLATAKEEQEKKSAVQRA